jgi:NAD(P) transhydrogenase subunit alpha
MTGIIEFIGNNLVMIYVVVLATFLGYELISKVPTVLHTPLMSGSNAISGVVLIGGVLLLRNADSVLGLVMGFLGVILGAINVVGGHAVTDRMLEMFKKKKA